MTDSQIIDLYWQRSETAISETHAAYGPYCPTLAFRILFNREDAEEVVTDTYLKLWGIIPPQRPDPLRGILGRITRQLSINRLEHDTAKKRGGEYPLILGELETCAGNSPADPTEQLALKEALETFLKALPPVSRRIFLLRYWHFYSLEEIGTALDLGQSRVKMQLLRTRQKLRGYLQQEGLL